MSGTVKVGDVIALPVGIEPREGDPNFVRLYDASNFGVCPRIAKIFAVKVKDAINNHDRMREALEHLRERFGRHWWNKDGPESDGRLVSEAIDAALQACDAQQENADG